jgi:hypothetical protein
MIIVTVIIWIILTSLVTAGSIAVAFRSFWIRHCVGDIR